MRSRVYFIKVENSDTVEATKTKLVLLLKKSGLFSFIRKDERVAIKMHFGEEGNTGYVKPGYVRVAIEGIKEKGARPFLSDTNTLYRGKRMNCRDHLQLAFEHGFSEKACGAPVVITDDSRAGNVSDVRINGQFIQTAKVAKLFLDADTIVGIAHFKGHMMTGFGGALKNLGMGCASRQGKLAQHSDISPFIRSEICCSCEECINVCPSQAIRVIEKKAYIDSEACIGCATCIAVCHTNAVEVKWEAGGENIQEKMVEYAQAVLGGKKDRGAFLNFALKITKECDCLAKDDPRIAPDVGIFASDDPVSIDKASFDMVIKACGKDIFKEAHPHRDGLKQLHYAQKLGLGNLDYELLDLS